MIPSGSERVVARRGGVGEEGTERERERVRERERGRQSELRQSNCSSMWKGDKRKVWKGSPEGGGYGREGWGERRDGLEKKKGKSCCRRVRGTGTVVALKGKFMVFFVVAVFLWSYCEPVISNLSNLELAKSTCVWVRWVKMDDASPLTEKPAETSSASSPWCRHRGARVYAAVIMCWCRPHTTLPAIMTSHTLFISSNN